MLFCLYFISFVSNQIYIIMYEVTFKHLITGEKRNFKLAEGRTQANEEWRRIRKKLSIWWRSGIIYC